MEPNKQTKRYLTYFKTIPCDEWHLIEDFAPNNPFMFVDYLLMLPKGGREVKGNKFKIIGKL